MRTMDAARSTLLVIDFQQRLMPAIHDAATAVANAGRLLAAADALGVPVVVTEQNPAGLGGTVADLPVASRPTVAKFDFDATRDKGFRPALPADRADFVVCGCEAHVCVLQTVLGLLDAGHRVFLVADAIGSRRPESRHAAIDRMSRHGAEIVTTEMVVFEWLGTSARPEFKPVSALIR